MVPPYLNISLPPLSSIVKLVVETLVALVAVVAEVADVAEVAVVALPLKLPTKLPVDNVIPAESITAIVVKLANVDPAVLLAAYPKR